MVVEEEEEQEQEEEEEEEDEEEEEEDEEAEDAFGNLTHLRINVCLQYKDALGTAAATFFIR